MAIVENNYRKTENPFSNQKEGAESLFTFKGKDKNMFIFPPTHNKEMMDIGWRQLISTEGKQYGSGINSILENFSTVRICECVQETKIDTIISAIKSLVTGWKKGVQAWEESDKDSNKLGIIGRFLAKAVTTTTFLNSLLGENSELPDVDPHLKLAYALRFCLMNRAWLNTYEFPYDNSQLYVSNGTDGWQREESGFGGTSNNSFLGKMLNFFGSQIRIASEPIWQGTSQDSQTQIQIKVNLFNNNIDQATRNYRLIQNIMPNNLYLQYGIIQQAPAYYDVHILGNRRYPLCKANFTCNAKGLFRKIDVINIDDFPTTADKYTIEMCRNTNHELRIPDAYELDMTFQSILPDSFNDFLYYWSIKEDDMNPRLESTWNKGEPASSIEKLITAGKTLNEEDPAFTDQDALEEKVKNIIVQQKIDAETSSNGGFSENKGMPQNVLEEIIKQQE